MKIVIAEPIGLSQDMVRKYNDVFSENTLLYFDTVPTNEKECIERCKDADIVVVSTYKLPREVLQELNALKMIAVAFTGYDHIDTNYCKENGISVSNAAGYSTIAVAEQTILMILSLLRNARKMENNCRNLKDRENFLGNELYGKTVGIIGFGDIGQKTAKLLDAFGCNVIIAQRNSIPPKTKFKQTPLNQLLETSDIVSLHIPYNASNDKLIDKKALQKMKKSAFLINTARAGLVDNEALAEALNKKNLAGAAIDVFETEPPLPPNHQLLKTESTILLPHTAFATQEAIEKRSEIILNKIWSWINGKGGNIVA